MTDTFPEPIATSLGILSQSEWYIVSATWSRGINWVVGKVGKRHWHITLPAFQFQAFPLFRTKGAAYDVATALILAEARHRAWLHHNKERAA